MNNDYFATKITEEEKATAITDKFGAKYTADGLKLIRVPENLRTYHIQEGTKMIADEAFYGCSLLKSVIIPDSVESIGAWAFAECCRLRSIIIPESVRDIGRNAFLGCEELGSIVILSLLVIIDDDVCLECESLHDIVAPDPVCCQLARQLGPQSKEITWHLIEDNEPQYQIKNNLSIPKVIPLTR